MKKIKKSIAFMACMAMILCAMPVRAQDEHVTNPVSIDLMHIHTGDGTAASDCYVAVYHNHSGNSTNGGGCYTVKQSGYINRCSACQSNNHAGHVGSGSCWYDPGYGWHCNCGDYSEWYSVGCGKTPETIEGYTLGCGLTEESIMGIFNIMPSEQTNIVKEMQLAASVIPQEGSLNVVGYLWGNGETTEQITANENGLYACTVTYQDGTAEYTKELSIDVKNIDSLIPTVSANLVGWAKDDVTVKIVAADSPGTGKSLCSGLPEDAYSWDAGNTWEIETEKTFNVPGNYEIWVRDNAGNIAKKVITVQIDRTAPVVSLSGGGGWTTGNVDIVASAHDVSSTVSGGDVSGGDASGGTDISASGLADEAYSWDGGSTWTNSNCYTATDNGSYSVMVRDNAGNISSANIDISNIDRDAPAITIEKEYENWPWDAASMDIMVNAVDTKSGLAAEAYCFDGMTWTSNNVYTIQESGKISIAVRDALGNTVWQDINCVRAAAPTEAPREVIREIIPVPPSTETPKPSPSPTPSPTPKPKPTPITTIEPTQEPQIIDIPEPNTPTFSMPKFIAATSTGTATSGMVVFIVFWIFRKCHICNESGKHMGKACIWKKKGQYFIKIPKKICHMSGTQIVITFGKNFVKANTGKPVNISVNGQIHQKDIKEKIVLKI